MKYIADLIYPDTVSTMPMPTMEAFRDHGVARPSDEDFDKARVIADDLADLGIDLDEVAETLQRRGVEAFIASHYSTHETLEERMEELVE